MEREFIVLGPFDIPVKRYPSGRLIDSERKHPWTVFGRTLRLSPRKKALQENHYGKDLAAMSMPIGPVLVTRHGMWGRPREVLGMRRLKGQS